jgi:hypothetical protein
MIAAEQRTDQQATGQRPQHIHPQPLPAAVAQFVHAEQTEPEHHERKRRAVIQPALAGQAEAQAVAIIRLVHLNIRGEHRVGRGQNAAEQNSRPQRQRKQIDTDPRDQAHRQGH